MLSGNTEIRSMIKLALFCMVLRLIVAKLKLFQPCPLHAEIEQRPTSNNTIKLLGGLSYEKD